MAPPSIAARELSKRFRIPVDRPATLKERALHPFRRQAARELQALDGISFEVPEGEFFGIVGANGSGKSTLLKLLARIYHPDAGTVEVRGRLSPLIELGVGFHDELAARDNVLINCALLGLTRREALRRFDSIIEFAELEDFIDLKLRNYSSGMKVRLAFSTAIRVDAQVILLDEVLAVGDASFQQKCFDVFRRLRGEGRTVVLVTHGLETVERFCDRAMLLDNGSAIAIGAPDEVIKTYRERTPVLVPSGDGAAPAGAGAEAEIVEAWFEDREGRRVEALEQGEPMRFVAEALFHREVTEPALGVEIYDEQGILVLRASSFWSEGSRPSFGPGDRARIEVSFENILRVGRHSAAPAISDRDATRLIDYRAGAAGILVTGKRWTGSVVDIPYEIRVEER